MPFKPPEQAKCPKCGKSVYAAEERVAAGAKYHKFCFKCGMCNKMLDSTTVANHELELFCKQCHGRRYGPKGYGFGGGAGALGMDKGERFGNKACEMEPTSEAAKTTTTTATALSLASDVVCAATSPRMLPEGAGGTAALAPSVPAVGKLSTTPREPSASTRPGTRAVLIARRATRLWTPPPWPCTRRRSTAKIATGRTLVPAATVSVREPVPSAWVERPTHAPTMPPKDAAADWSARGDVTSIASSAQRVLLSLVLLTLMRSSSSNLCLGFSLKLFCSKY